MSDSSPHAAAPKSKFGRSFHFLCENSLFLIGGSLLALIWANSNFESYHHFVEWSLPVLPELTMHFLVNDIFMAVFFAIAAKEVWESFLPGGSLSELKKATTPLLATLGGVLIPAGCFLVGAWSYGEMDTIGKGWAIPCATDIAFSYLVARLIFGAGHPAIAFLLLLAIADDAAGLIILAVAYPQEAIQVQWFLLTAAAIGLGITMRKFRVQSHWWYLLVPGVMSWISFHEAGIHAALGLVPIIPTLPHAKTDLGLFAEEELQRTDTLSAFEHFWQKPVEVFLGLFGAINAGVVFSNVGPGTWLVLLGLLVGKPLGIAGFTWVGQKLFKLELSEGMNFRDIVVVGFVAGIGFTVSLFVAAAAFPVAGPIQDSMKMGALASFFAAVLSFAVAKWLGVSGNKVVVAAETSLSTNDMNELMTEMKSAEAEEEILC